MGKLPGLVDQGVTLRCIGLGAMTRMQVIKASEQIAYVSNIRHRVLCGGLFLLVYAHALTSNFHIDSTRFGACRKKPPAA